MLNISFYSNFTFPLVPTQELFVSINKESSVTV